LKKLHWYVLIGIGSVFLAFFLKLEVQVISSLQLLLYTLIMTRKESGEDPLKTLDLRLVEKIIEYPGNLENSLFRSFSNIGLETSYQEIFKKAAHDNINGFPMEKVLLKHSKSSDETIKILMKLFSSLFAKDAASAKGILSNYIVILKENEILKNERRNIFSEARFRARIMLVISALLMGFLSAAGPLINTFSTFSKPLLQLNLSQTLSLLLYLISVSLLVHYTLSYKKLLRTLLYSATSFTISFIIFRNILITFLPYISS
jgi:hypothetical protein